MSLVTPPDPDRNDRDSEPPDNRNLREIVFDLLRAKQDTDAQIRLVRKTAATVGWILMAVGLLLTIGAQLYQLIFGGR